jgi:hypothetical protein
VQRVQDWVGIYNEDYTFQPSKSRTCEHSASGGTSFGKPSRHNSSTEYTNVSLYNTTIYFIYIKWYIDRATCFDLHWIILRPSKKADPRLHICSTETHSGIPNAHRML